MADKAQYNVCASTGESLRKNVHLYKLCQPTSWSRWADLVEIVTKTKDFWEENAIRHNLTGPLPITLLQRYTITPDLLN